jgi:hypothetical protein
MAALPFPKSTNVSGTGSLAVEDEPMNWVGLAAAGTLVAGGLLLLCGNRRAGLVLAVSGTALTLLDQKEAVRLWWNALPGHIDKVQGVLGQAQDAIAEISAQRERIRRIMVK